MNQSSTLSKGTFKHASQTIRFATDVVAMHGKHPDRIPTKDWEPRTRMIAELIQPGSSVIEFGAGKRVMERLLSAECSYTPSDLVDRGTGTIVCDLNAENLPDFPPHDVAVFSGVLEYVNDVPKLLSHLADDVAIILASYAVVEASQKNRRRNGWVNDFSRSELIEIFVRAGFTCELMSPWKTQVIFKFAKKTLP